MADFDNNSVPVATKPLSSNALLFAHCIYGLFAFVAISTSFVGPLASFVGFIGVIAAHVFRSDVQGTWLHSHYSWLIRTFWWSFAWTMLGWLVMVTLGWVLIGIPIAFAIWGLVFLWTAYRLIRGWINLFADKAIS